MNTSAQPQSIYETLGKLMFDSGLPQLLGLYPDHNLHAETDAQEAAAMLSGMLKAITRGEHFDGQEIHTWKDDSFIVAQEA